ncbi:MAG: hypothetical protein AAGB00_05260 [Planctomycetota bacterium]
MADNALHPSLEHLLQSSNGPVSLTGASGEQYVAMSRRVYDAMLGVSGDDAAETLASVLRGVADVEAGRTYSVEEAATLLENRHGG